MFRPTEKDARALEARGCRYKFDTIKRHEQADDGSPVFLRDKEGKDTRNLRFKTDVIRCSIIDNVTGRVVAKAEAPNDEEAFTAALASSYNAPKPRTIAETEAENVALRARLKALEAGRAPDDSVTTVTPQMEAESERAEDDLAALREEAEMLGVTVDGRWKAARLRQEIARATAEGQTEIDQKMQGAS